METIIKTEYAKRGEKEYVICSKGHERAIYGDDGVRLDRKLKGLQSDINDLGGGGIVDTQTGTTAISTASADSYIELHDIFGQSSQEGIPTPESQAEIKSVGGTIKSYEKNELSKEELKKCIPGDGVKVNETDNGIRVFSTAAGSTRHCTCNVSLLPDTLYYISFQFETASGKQHVNVFDGTKTVPLASDNTGTGITFTSPEDGKIVIYFYCTTADAESGDITYQNIQIQQGGVSETFNEYATCAELPALRSVGEIKDKLYRDYDGLLKVERSIGTLTLNGNENWKYADVYSAGEYAVFYAEGILKSASRETMSNKFEYWNGTDYKSVDKNILGINAAQTNIDIGIKKTIASDIPTFKAWLSSNQTAVQYILDKPAIEILPAEQQIRLNGLKSFEGKTTVYTASQIQPTLTVDFYSKSVGYGIDRSNAVHNAIDLSINRRMVSNTAVTEPGFLPDALLVSENAREILKNKENISHAHGYINSSFPFNAAGWIRIARNKNAYAAIRGGSADSCTITIKRGYSYDDNEMVQINLDKVYQKTRLTLVRKFYNRQIITKVRHVFSAEEAFIEVLYESNSGNGAYIEIDNPLAGTGGWEAIAPEPTQETVSGYTVDAELDLTREYGSALINDAYERYHLDSSTPLKLGINLREWRGNKCYLISYAGYWGEGAAHQAVMWLLSCGYNKDAYNIVEIGSAGKNDGYLPTFSVDSNGFIVCTPKNNVGGFITVLRM